MIDRTNIFFIVIISILGFLCLITFVQESSGKTITVDDDGSEQYTSIQAAVDAADSGDTVFVKRGYYHESVHITKPLILRGDDRKQVIIDAGGGNRVEGIKLTAENISVSGFTVMNASSPRVDSGGIVVRSSNNIIYNNILRNNKYSGLNVIHADYSIVYNNLIYDNKMSLDIGGSDYGHFYNNEINASDYGIITEGCDYSLFENNRIFDNENVGFSLFQSRHNLVRNNHIHNNHEGGISVSKLHGRWNILLNNTINNNTEFGVKLDEAYNNSIYQNRIINNSIGILCDKVASSNKMKYNLIYDNDDYGIQLIRRSKKYFNASVNWWNHESGPYHPENNSNGHGDEVSDNIPFSPWIAQLPAAFIHGPFPNVVIAGTPVDLQGFIATKSNVKQYRWTSSIDGLFSTSLLYNTTVANLSLGEHEIILRVVHQDETFIDSDPIILIVHEKPIAVIESIIPEMPTFNSSVVFVGGSTEDQEIVNYTWKINHHNGTIIGFGKTFTVSNLTQLPVGLNNVSLNVRESHGLWSDEVIGTFYLHNSPHIVTFRVSPEVGKHLRQISLSADGADDGRITEYRWVSDIDGVVYSGLINETMVTNLSIGMHTISLSIKDDGGAWSEAISFNYQVERGPNFLPFISISSPANNSEIGGIISINGNASDVDGSVEYVELSIADGNWMKSEGTTIWNYVLNSKEFENGQIIVKCRAYDGEDYSEIISISLTINNPDDDHENDETFLLGFGMTTVIWAVGITLVLLRKKSMRYQ